MFQIDLHPDSVFAKKIAFRLKAARQLVCCLVHVIPSKGLVPRSIRVVTLSQRDISLTQSNFSDLLSNREALPRDYRLYSNKSIYSNLRARMAICQACCHTSIGIPIPANRPGSRAGRQVGYAPDPGHTICASFRSPPAQTTSGFRANKVLPHQFLPKGYWGHLSNPGYPNLSFSLRRRLRDTRIPVKPRATLLGQ